MEGILENLVRIGTVSSVDPDKRTARVIFTGHDNMVSGELKVLQNQPLLVINKTVDGDAWDYSAQYASAPRSLGLGEKYTKSFPDVIQLEATIEYEKNNTIPDSSLSCSYTGVIDTKTHRHVVKVYPWLPYIGQLVLCLYLPVFNGDGFILGGI